MSNTSDLSLPIIPRTPMDSNMDSTEPLTPATTFPKFTSLPAEIRLRIWEAARPTPRFLKLYCRGCRMPHFDRIRYHCPERPSHPGTIDHDVYSSAPVPSLLHVCFDSRKMALNWYKLSFDSEWYAPKVYFDWEQDGLYTHCDGTHRALPVFCTHESLYVDFLQDADAEGLKRLAIEGPCGLEEAPWMGVMYWLRNLKDLYLVTGNGAGSRSLVEEKDFVVSDEPFEWQEGTLMEMCNTYKTWRAAHVFECRKVERVTVADVEELQDDHSGSSSSPGA